MFTRYGKTIGCDQDFLSDIEEVHIHRFGECTPYRDQKANPRADSSICQKGCITVQLKANAVGAENEQHPIPSRRDGE